MHGTGKMNPWEIPFLRFSYSQAWAAEGGVNLAGHLFANQGGVPLLIMAVDNFLWVLLEQLSPVSENFAVLQLGHFIYYLYESSQLVL